MFIGHYGPALALKAAAPKTPVFALVAACQIMDYVWAGLILGGVEKAHIEPGQLEGSALALTHMPYSHSLLGAAMISAAFAAIVTLLMTARSLGVFVALFLAGVSHWFADLLVHAPDLTLTGSPPYLGFGLWAYKWPSFALEVILVAVGLWLCARATRYTGPWGAVSPWIMGGVLLVLGVVNAVQPPPASIEAVALSALAAYSVVVAAGAVMDRTRAPHP
jgi:hypothetical protein